MRRNSRLLDLTLMVALLSLVALSQRNSTPPGKHSAQTLAPRPTVSPSATPQPEPGGALWSDSSLSLKLRQLPGPGAARRVRLQLTLSNKSGDSCWIPGTFCQESQEADWWSHAVRAKVDYAYRADLACPLEPGVNLNPRGPWILGPSYGERGLHEHPSFPSLIKPQQQMQWEFCLGDLVEGIDGSAPSPGWERAEGPFRVTCELSQPGHRVLSNPLEIAP